MSTTYNTEGESTDSHIIFNWDSDYKKNHMTMYKNQTERQLQILDNTFSGRNLVIRDEEGRRLVNASEERLWFKEYVSLIFSIGCIFTEKDREKLNEILKCFENDGETGFLMNYKNVMDYDAPLIQELEKRVEIGNGNYHVCLITLVTTNDKSILANAPEKQYGMSGVVNKYCEWKDIYNYMMEIVARYGMVVEQEVHHDDKLSWEMGQEGKSVKTVRHSEVESSFNIDIDPEDESLIMRDRELEFKKEKDEFFNVRQRNTKMSREDKDGSYNPHRNRFTKNGSLYTRIQREEQCGITDDSLIDEKKGIQLRMNESKVPLEKIRAEYQLYENPDTYEGGRNKALDASTREQIPVFQQVSRGVKSRIPTNNPLAYVRNGSDGGRRW